MNDSAREAKRWFSQALDDRRFIQWLQGSGRFFDKGCFIAQQAGEKALKACLYGLGRRSVIGHSLFEMVSELIRRSDTFNPLIDPCRRLDRFYIPTRYPNGLPGGSPFEVFTASDLDTALTDVNAVITASQAFLCNLGVDVDIDQL